jgi:hypothetical protein
VALLMNVLKDKSQKIKAECENRLLSYLILTI